MTVTPRQIQSFLDENMHRMDLPVQFLGDEPNVVHRDWDSAAFRMLVCAPWAYEVASGNQSVPAVYKAVRVARDDFLADRWYLPSTPRDMRVIEKAGIPVFGVETKHPLTDFDVVGCSISYPVLAISWFKFLLMSGVPLRWRDRQERAGDWPMVIVGGQTYGAPETVAPVVDAFWLGEVEDEPGNPGIGAVAERIAEFKEDGLWTSDREQCYRELASEFNFLYFPRFVDVEYAYEDRRATCPDHKHDSKQVVSWTTNLPGLRAPFLKRFVQDMDATVPLDDPPLLFSDPAMGAGDIEVGRGCPAWCSFCALTYRQKPYRQRSVPFMVEYAASSQRHMGSTHLTPYSPDFPMHTQKKVLIAELLEKVSDEVDSSSMRVDDFIADSDYILLQVHGGMDGVTLGVEGNSQRMRDLVGKGCADEDIMEAVARGIRAGIRKFKLYMISNLPGEDEGDVYRILRLAKALADIRESMGQPNVRIQFSWTPLLIEANTPFQWFAPPLVIRALGDVWEEFRDINIDFKLGGKAEPNKAALFQLCQRASREVGEAIVDLIEEMDGPGQGGTWGGVPRWTKDRLRELLHERGFHNGYDDCFDERFKHDMFGWEFIDQGISTELLWVTYLQMREFVENTDSATYDLDLADDYHGNEWIERCDTKCYGKSCGVCSAKDLKIRRGYIQGALQEATIDMAKVKVVDQRSITVKVRARVVKDSDGKRFVENDHWRYAVRRAAYQAQYKLGTEYGIAKRSIKFVSDSVTYKDWTSGVDYVEFALTRKVSRQGLDAFCQAMNDELRGLRLERWRLHPADSPVLRSDVDLSLFELEVDVDVATAVARVRAWEAADEVKLVLKSDGGYFAAEREEVNAKDYVDDLWLVRDGHRLFLKMLLRGRPSPYNVYAALMGRASWIEAASKPAIRLDAFVDVDQDQFDFLRPACLRCERVIPVNVLDESWDQDHCPRCQDEDAGRVVREVTYA